MDQRIWMFRLRLERTVTVPEGGAVLALYNVPFSSEKIHVLATEDRYRTFCEKIAEPGSGLQVEQCGWVQPNTEPQKRMVVLELGRR